MEPPIKRQCMTRRRVRETVMIPRASREISSPQNNNNADAQDCRSTPPTTPPSQQQSSTSDDGYNSDKENATPVFVPEVWRNTVSLDTWNQ